MTEQQPMQPQMTTMDMGSLLDKLLSFRHIPPEIRKKYWGFFNPNIILSNLGDRQIDWMMNNYELFEVRLKRKWKGHKFDLDAVIEMNQIKNDYFAILNRARDGFERDNQVTQIFTQITNEGKHDPIHNTGVLGNIIRKIKGD